MRKETQLSKIFRTAGEAFFSEYPQLKHKWINDSPWVTLELEIERGDDFGFNVTAAVRDSEVIVFGSGAHQHLELQGDENQLVSDAFGLIYDLLSPAMRVIEYRAGGKPYRWVMQTEIDGDWKTDITTCLLIWKFFSKKEEIVLQNKLLPRREIMVEQLTQGELT